MGLGNLKSGIVFLILASAWTVPGWSQIPIDDILDTGAELAFLTPTSPPPRRKFKKPLQLSSRDNFLKVRTNKKEIERSIKISRHKSIKLEERQKQSALVYIKEKESLWTVLYSTNSPQPKEIEEFLRYKKSPMAKEAKEIWQACKDYQIDPAFFIAVSGIESGYGKHCSSYNSVGWGGGKINFSSYSSCARAFAKGIKANYANWALDEKMARKYCPPNWNHWLFSVRAFWQEFNLYRINH